MIQLNSVTFWMVCGTAILLLVPVRSAGLRKALLASVNVTLLVLLLHWSAFAVLVGVAGTYIALNLVQRSDLRGVIATLLAVALGALFVLHKRPELAGRVHLTGVSRMLAVIGYSYIALRIIEVLRAVFERRHKAPDLVSTINYLLPFHMLAAGPIQAYDDFVAHSNDEFTPTPASVLIAFERIASGLFKKLVLAHMLQLLFLTNLQTTGLYFLFEMQLTLVWLYLDFSAYSDIAVGIGILLGVATPENFRNPLLARNLIDFWERWHISLSQFIRRNIFIPLQMFLMRRNDGRTPLMSAVVAISISFVLCGLWHGLGAGFLLWGVLQAGGLVVARVYGHVLERRLGRAGVRRYLANPWFRLAGVVLTFELQASALVALVRV